MFKHHRSTGYPYDALQMGGSALKTSQPDEKQFRNLRQAMRGNMQPFEQIVKLLDAKNLPPQLRSVPFVAKLQSNTDIELILPANPSRMGFILAFIDSNLNDDAFLLFSYNAPPFPGVGLPLVSTVPYSESNGTVSVDEIYVMGSAVFSTNVTFPATVLAYEQTLAVESHLHEQTSGQ